LRTSEERFRIIFESVSDGIIVQDATTEAFLDVNPRQCAMLGYTRDELLALGPADISGGSRTGVTENLEALQTTAPQPGHPFEWLFRAKDGREFWCEVSRQYVSFDGRDVFLSTVRDISERKQATADLTYRDRILHALALSSAELVRTPSFVASMPSLLQAVSLELGVDRMLVIQRTGVEHQSAGAAYIYGWQREDVPQVDMTKISAPMHDADETAAMGKWLAPLFLGKPVVTQAASATGLVGRMMREGRTLSSLLVPIFVGGAYWGHFAIDDTHREREWTSIEIDTLMTFADLVGALVTRERTGAEIELMASHDALTGLPNRRLFIEALEVAIRRARRSGNLFAVFSLDLDRFKDVNDTIGHPGGDRLLHAVATRLRASVRDVDTVARFGGDEFAAIQIDIREPADAAVLARKLVTVLHEPFAIAGNDVQSGTSIGIAVHGIDSPDAEALLAHADVALYRAKADGRGTYRFYTEAMDADVRARVAFESELRAGLAADQFFLVYQPQYDVDRRIVGLEALVRWHHPTRGVVSPATCIPAADRSGLTNAVEAWAFRAACRQITSWVAAGVAAPRVGVNVSALQFRNPLELEKFITSIAEEFGVPPPMVELAFTEIALMGSADQHDEVFLRLRARGFGLAIDDFGSGASSLEHLSRFPVDRIKIAPRFIADVGVVGQSTAIVRAAIGLAQALGFRVLAKGVDTAVQVDRLKDWGCQEMQGRHFTDPLLPGQIAPLLRR
jgi:diguanylate cyclase (GGDEF)-like protein/PAS domain S-box-containing protein